MKWLLGTKVIRCSSLVFPADLEERMKQPHVQALAESMKKLGGGPAHLPIVEWDRKPLTILVGGDRTAALIINGLKRSKNADTDGCLEVRAFVEATDEERAQLVRDENVHRRQDRDRWLRLQVEQETQRVAAERAEIAVSERRGSASDEATAPDDPPEAEGGDALQEELGDAPETGIAAEAGSPGPVAHESTKAEKTEARKRVAAREKTTPAAVKQAEHRDRKRAGEAKPSRQKHDDSAGAQLSEADLQVQKALIDAEAHVSRAVVRLRNLLEKRADLGRAPLMLSERVRDLETWVKTLKWARQEQGL